MNGIKLTVTGILFLLMALFLSAPAHAGLHHDHHSLDSVFQKASKGKHAHCVLRGHSQNNPCPHILHPKGPQKNIVIGTDCGGASLPVSLPSIQKISLINEGPIQKSLSSSKYQLDSFALYLGSSLNTIDHPPKR